MIHTGDCIEVMRGMEADSVDAVVTDPPYGLEFMGKGWDKFGAGIAVATEGMDRSHPFRDGSHHVNYGKPGAPFQAWCEAWGAEALRVTKPGGYLLAFGGTRTHHRLVCGLEDAGWIIRDELDWIYASGFPKGKANLKPAHEPIVLARKPGPLRPLGIDATRIGISEADVEAQKRLVGYKGNPKFNGTDYNNGKVYEGDPATLDAAAERDPLKGRWPSNLLLSDPELFDEPNPYVVGSGATSGTEGQARIATRPRNKGWVNSSPGDGVEAIDNYGDSGGYSRFFIIPKADRADREPIVRGSLEPAVWSDGREVAADYPSQRGKTSRENSHPTVKPTDLMRHLVRLVTPPGGTVLDCFAGSGSTLIAAEMEGFAWIGIEQDASYVAIAEARLNGTQRGLGLDVPAPTRTKPMGGPFKEDREAKGYTTGDDWIGQSSLFRAMREPDEEPAA